MSVCLHTSVWLSLEIFPWNWVLGTFIWKSVKKIQIWLKLDTSVRHFIWRPKYVLLLCNSQCFCIFDHAMQLNNTRKMQCCISSSTMVTQTYHNVMLYVYCVFCFHTNGSKQMGNITVCIIFQWHLHIKFLNAQAFQRKTMVILCLLDRASSW